MPCLLLLGPAGSGKTTLARVLGEFAIARGSFHRVSTCNLDPGTIDPLPWTIDVRDVFTTRQLMETHGLGPNGAVSKAYELLAGSIDGLFHGVDNATDHLVIIDTPGQLDPLVFSETGTVLLSALARRFPGCTGVFLLPADVVNDPAHHAFLVLVLAGLGLALPVPVVHVISKADLLDTAARERLHDPAALERDVVTSTSGMTAEFSTRAASIARQLLPSIHPVLVSVGGDTASGLDELLDLLDEAGCACGDLS